ncbi:polynucleotide kinase-phosphatase [Streptomyces sp. SID3343]|uniref:polynucleotide kinase-phosphatase n=1 Tax=Streptomyces sp. SID3343 TaxID=2690260 RepID=UPI00136C7F0F|nr:polynucleotide kinase-phosphatase [Streptomyces sp. SID3343]MYW01209.1 polynucleotide kinase-phosphatase [Streptomyces sp. SID3343]
MTHEASDRRELTMPDLCLVVLVGTTGAGKSTFARTHFKPTQVLSSDYFRGLVADDENDQSASRDAFELLHHVARMRLASGRLTVVDATNVQREARAQLVALAREADLFPVAIVLDVPPQECQARNADRPDRMHLPPQVIQRQHRDLRKSLRGLQREGFRKVHVLKGVEEIAKVDIVHERRYNDLRHLTGPFDLIGDIHGCRAELESLLVRLGYALERNDAGAPIDAVHPDGRTAVFVGDLVDRGPDTPGVLRLVMGMVGAGNALCVPGNHENKLVRALKGRQVKTTHGLAESLEQLAAESEEFRSEVVDFCESLVSHYLLDEGKLVVCHAGLPEKYHGRMSGRVRSFALYGDTTGETDEYGLPVRYPWADEYRGKATVVYGHTPTPRAVWVNNTICLDTGAVFGGDLTALRWPERELVAVAAEQVWYEPVRPLASDAPGGRDGRTLDLGDVLDLTPGGVGRRHIETAGTGMVTVRQENAAAALEIMSRFAIDPRWLVYLPPTMAPCATSDLPGLLEHPAEAFAQFRADGVTRVMCEEKHMGSRAVALVCRDEEAARKAFGVDEGMGSGAVWTRTGRGFFHDREVTDGFLARLRASIDAAGLWDELGTDWLLFDAELMPWSAKAQELLRQQYASVGAAATAALPVAGAALARAAARGIDVADLAGRITGREANAHAFVDAYGRYCWDTDGLDGLRFAPFQVLAGEGMSYLDKGHDWHLALLDRLVAADTSGLLAPTGRLVVDVTDDEQVAAGIAWWEGLTAVGGEGMVVKPLAGEADRVTNRRVQPGVKCRGPEYLRIIYGADYTEPVNLDRLRDRGLGHKRSLALREHALGAEALTRLAAGEALWRVHETVFAVLALESEPVDPRL